MRDITVLVTASGAPGTAALLRALRTNGERGVRTARAPGPAGARLAEGHRRARARARSAGARLPGAACLLQAGVRLRLTWIPDPGRNRRPREAAVRGASREPRHATERRARAP